MTSSEKLFHVSWSSILRELQVRTFRFQDSRIFQSQIMLNRNSIWKKDTHIHWFDRIIRKILSVNKHKSIKNNMNTTVDYYVCQEKTYNTSTPTEHMTLLCWAKLLQFLQLFLLDYFSGKKFFNHVLINTIQSWALSHTKTDNSRVQLTIQ